MKEGICKIIVGDVTKPQRCSEDEIVVIPHVCNDLGIMGGGVALGLKRKWPKIEDVYKQKKDLKDCSFVEVGDNIIIANMVAQSGFMGETNPKPIKYEALIRCIIRVKDYALVNNCTIHTPKFGSLRAGGNWDFVLELIREIWVDNGIDVTIYEYKG